jgi:hypothetical protein
MAFSVAMNAKRANSIVALLIASNFGEIKGAGQNRNFRPYLMTINRFFISENPSHGGEGCNNSA